jgi:phosphatidylglycerol---prolipoprotein diacylglyceryl transferase
MIFLASIPSPSSGAIDLGPFQIHMYGLTLLVAIAVCMWITGTRYVHRGGDWDIIFRCAVWGVGAGIIGARLYHLATSWDEVPDQWWGPFAIWKGGLGVWGGIALGCLVGGLIAKRAGADVWLLADCLAPGLLVAQAIGRIGNWWNQELYGKATDLPWGLEIDPAQRPLGLIDRTTYHPTFLYELLWDLFVAALLVFVIERRFRPRPPGIFALYIALYSFGRFWIEFLRVDPANEIWGQRVNTWVSALVCIAGIVWFVLSQRRGQPGEPRERRERLRFRRRAQQQPQPGPKMAVPKGRVRRGG